MNTTSTSKTRKFPLKERIRLFTTGGAIDAASFMDGSYIYTKTHIPTMLTRAFCKLGTVRYDVLMLKDSLLMDDADRDKILKACRASKEKRIVILHGTDTMVRTGAHLARNFATQEFKTIVLTGARKSFGDRYSDAPFNVGYALAAAQFLPHGVYIAMNGRVLNWNDARRNQKSEFFETRDGK